MDEKEDDASHCSGSERAIQGREDALTETGPRKDSEAAIGAGMSCLCDRPGFKPMACGSCALLLQRTDSFVRL